MAVRWIYIFSLLFINVHSYAQGTLPDGYYARPEHYGIIARLDPAKHEIVVQAKIRLRVTDTSQSVMMLGFDSLFTVKDIVDGNMNTLSFTVRYREGTQYIIMEIPETLRMQKGGIFTLQVRYFGVIETFVSRVNIISKKLTEMGQSCMWYPRDMDYKSLFTYSLDITAPDDQTVVAPGRFVSLKKVEKSAPGRKRWLFVSTGNKEWTLVFFASNILKNFSVSTPEGNAEICYFESDKKNVAALAEDIGKIISFNTKKYGKLDRKILFRYFLSPRNGWSYVRGDMIVMPEKHILPDSMAGVLSAQTFKYLAHEFSHLWWGTQGVRFIRDKDHPNANWLTEGLAEFSSLRLTEHYRDNESSLLIRKGLLGQIAKIPENIPVSKALRDSCRDWYHWRNLTYYESAYIFYMLLNTLGESKFDNLMKGLFSEYSGRELSTGEMLQYLKRVNPEAEGFLVKWMNARHLPKYLLQYEIHDNQTATVHLSADWYTDDLPVEILVSSNEPADKKVYVLKMNKSQIMETLSPGFLVKLIELDPYCRILMRDR